MGVDIKGPPARRWSGAAASDDCVTLSGLRTGVLLDVVVIQSKNESSWDTNVFPKIESTLRAIFNASQSPVAIAQCHEKAPGPTLDTPRDPALRP